MRGKPRRTAPTAAGGRPLPAALAAPLAPAVPVAPAAPSASEAPDAPSVSAAPIAPGGPDACDVPVAVRRPDPAVPDARARRIGPDVQRAAWVLAVVALHATLAYVPLPWWYVDDPRKSPALFLLCGLLDGPPMPALFWLAGFFSLEALVRRGPAGFAKARVMRLGIPLVGLTLLVNPVISWVYAASRGQGTGLGAWWIQVLASPRNFDCAVLDTLDAAARYATSLSPYHLWFLGLLLVFSVLLAGAAALRPGLVRQGGPRHRADAFAATASGAAWTDGPRDRADGQTLGNSQGRTLVWFGLVALAEMLAQAVWDDRVWIRLGPFLNVQAARLPLYAGFFLLGVRAARQHVPASPTGRAWPFVLAALVCGAATLAALSLASQSDDPLLRAGHGLVRTAYAAFALVAVRRLSARLSGPPGPALVLVCGASFVIYLWHMPVAAGLQYLLLGGSQPAWAAFALVFAGAAGLPLALWAALRRVRASARG